VPPFSPFDTPFSPYLEVSNLFSNVDVSRILANFFSAFFISLSGATLSGAGLDGIAYALLTAVIVGGLSAANEWKKEEERTDTEQEANNQTIPQKMSVAALILPFP